MFFPIELDICEDFLINCFCEASLILPKRRPTDPDTQAALDARDVAGEHVKQRLDQGGSFSMKLDPLTTALVMIDLQNGVMGRQLAPHTASEVLERTTKLAGRFRAEGAPVVWVRVRFAADFADAPSNRSISRSQRRPTAFQRTFPSFPKDLSHRTTLRSQSGSGAHFYGTDLELQLRRRGVTTIVLGGVATNFGVESTARQAWELGFAIVLAEDVTSSMSNELHDFALKFILPRIAIVSTSKALSFKEE